MAQFDVYKVAGDWLILDCQHDIFDVLDSRLTVPLERKRDGPFVSTRLNPSFDIRGEEWMMLTQFAGTVSARSLKQRVTSLAEYRLMIQSAIDMLTGGY